MSFDTVEENRAFAEKFDFPFLLLCDVERTIGLAYGACQAPDAPAPKRISYLIGRDRKVVRAYEKVNVTEHPAEVLEDIAALAR